MRMLGFADEMVVIGENRPGLEHPAVSLGEIEQQIGEDREKVMRVEERLFQVCAGRDHIGTWERKAMEWAVGPVAKRRDGGDGIADGLHEYG